MPNYNYKIIEWSTYDQQTPKDVIETESTGQWDYYDCVQIHAGRIDFVFRSRTN